MIQNENIDISKLNLKPFTEDGRDILMSTHEDGRPIHKLINKVEQYDDPETFGDIANEDLNKSLFSYEYDNRTRLTKVVVHYKMNFAAHWFFNNDIKYKYLGENPRPTQVNMSNGFWVANKYNPQYQLLQSVTSNGATLVQLYDHDGYLTTKVFRIPNKAHIKFVNENKYCEYKYTFGTDPKVYIQYEDSYGNFWDVNTGFDCPFENPVKVHKKDFLDNHEI
jgi:YD repeat-containing protein